MSAPPRYRLALFDFDGTLVDSFAWFLGVFDAVADRFGFRHLEPGDRERLRGLDARAILRDRGIPLWKLPRISRHMRDLAAGADIHPFPGVPALLAELVAGGSAVIVVTSNTESNVRRALGPAAAHVTHFACGAALFGKAAKIRGVLRATTIDPRAALMIGDEARDIDAARQAGIDCAAVAWGYTDPAFLRSLEPTLFFERLADIAPALLGQATTKPFA